MTLSRHVKKRIAKEILILFAGTLTWCLLAAIIYGYNSYQIFTCDKLINQKSSNSHIIDSLKDKTIEAFLDKWVPPSDAIVVKDSNGGEDVPLPPPPSKAFLHQDSIEQEFIKKLTLDNEKIQNGISNHTYSNDLQTTLLIIGCVLMAILYPLRFLYLTFLWALKTVGDKS